METAAGSGNDESQDLCVICLSNITEKAITVPCNHHTFDFICLVSWLQQRSTCPLCKTEVTAVQYDWRSPEDFKSYAVRSTHSSRDVPSRTASLTLFNDIRYRGLRLPRTSRRPYSPPRLDLALLRRRHVYRRKLYSLYVGSNRFSGYQDFTPEMIAHSLELQSRARTWIRRELRVFTFLHTDPSETPTSGPTTSSNAEFLLSYMLSILKQVDIKASNGHAEDLLSEFLGRDNTRLFLHELSSWLRSPYARPVDWDRNVQYMEDLPTSFDEQGLLLEEVQRRRYASALIQVLLRRPERIIAPNSSTTLQQKLSLRSLHCHAGFDFNSFPDTPMSTPDTISTSSAVTNAITTNISNMLPSDADQLTEAMWE